MNMKKIISTALTVIMLLTAIIAVIPTNAFAALSSTTDTETEENALTTDEVRAYIDEFYLKSSYGTAIEMLDAINEKYPDNIVTATSSNGKYTGKYTIHIDRYTGFVFYENNITGQILTSNPTDVATEGSSGEGERMNLMSQIRILFTESGNTQKTYDYNSIQWAARYSQISVSKISGGLRVNYTLGDTSTRFLLPGIIDAKDFHDYIVSPMAKSFQELYIEAMASVGIDKETAYSVLMEKYEANLSGVYTDKATPYYEYLYAKDLAGTTSEYVLDQEKVECYLDSAQEIYQDSKYALSADYKSSLSSLSKIIMNIFVTGNGYSLKDINSNKNFDSSTGKVIEDAVSMVVKEYPVAETMPIYVFDVDSFKDNKVATLRQYSSYIKAYCPDYTFDMMYEDEKECGFMYTAAQKPVFRCALEYTFNSDESLSVRLPANSIVFDETAYNLTSITPVQYFGCGDMSKDGYVFYPDGSGSILEFSDFYSEHKKVAVNVASKVYGRDYTYSFIEGKHREQITMPVYGVVSTVTANEITNKRFGTAEVKNGCFVILEEGNSLASLGFESGGSSYKYISAFASYNPYPTDKYELSETISVGTSGETNVMVGETKYAGSYVSRIVMLTDERIGESLYGNGNYYPTTYTGMATYYRNILKANGTLKAIENVETDIPLYIEALGAMTIMDKFLTFPVEKSIPLTTFENIITIYDNLSKAEAHVVDQYNYFISEAEKARLAENELLEIENTKKAEKYQELIGTIQNIKNVNFKLTGFANGGMNATYPTKLKWEKCCGGKSGFEDLVNASVQSSVDGYNFGIFPDFDFLYVSNTARFDGISKKGSVSRMIDNRYASKQAYNSVLGEFESMFAMVVSSDMLSEHFETFDEKYSEFKLASVSVSTIGSDLNSNFNEKNTIDREASMSNSVNLLEKMVYQKKYNVMLDTGNIYAAEFASHILNAPTDFSGFRFSSYAVPFVGMILHGHVSYSGSPLNYSGSPEYEILRSIESGANPYYIICYQNSAYMKDDPALSKYYGIDYENWYDEILVTYSEMNKILSELQTYEIVDHQTVIVERTPDEEERKANYNDLKKELILLLKAQAADMADAAVKAMGSDVKVLLDVDALYAQFANNILVEYQNEINNDVTADGKSVLREEIRAIAVEFANKYPGSYSSNVAPFVILSVNKTVVDEATGETVYTNDPYVSYLEYSEHSFTTNSGAFDGNDYVKTDYTLDTNNVVVVTYRNAENNEKIFVLNYNLFDVDVRIGGKTIRVDSYACEPIN